MPVFDFLNKDTVDYLDLFNGLDRTNYFDIRGISLSTQERYHLGTHPDGLNYFIKSSELEESPSKRFNAYKYFIPCIEPDGSIQVFLTRACEEYAHHHGIELSYKMHNLKGKTIKFFNQRYLTKPELANEIIFICEGVFDALSFEEIGYPAIAINSAQNADKLVDLVIKSSHKHTVFAVAGDNDEAGNKMVETLHGRLNQQGFHCEVFIYPKKYKDINEFIIADPKGLEESIFGFISTLGAPDAVSRYLDTFITQLEEKKGIKPIKTGFKKLDDVLGGGLFPGLYTIGAISSLGKTTFLLNIANYIAKDNQDVLFFSLEMSKFEMLAKSLSSMTGQIARERKTSTASSLRSIVTGSASAESLYEAFMRYTPAAKYLSVIEGNFDTDILLIQKRIKDHIKFRMKPVVIVDYLQIIKPLNDRMSDKQHIDRAVTSLKKMSRDFNIPIVLISSLNRENYSAPISYQAFKESGSVEYSSDCILGLQLEEVHRIQHIKNAAEKQSILNMAKRKAPREVELVLLKNRNGVPFASIPLKYYAEFNLFEEYGTN